MLGNVTRSRICRVGHSELESKRESGERERESKLHVTSRHVTSRHVTSRHVTSLHFTSHNLLSCGAETDTVHDSRDFLTSLPDHIVVSSFVCALRDMRLICVTASLAQVKTTVRLSPIMAAERA